MCNTLNKRVQHCIALHINWSCACSSADANNKLFAYLLPSYCARLANAFRGTGISICVLYVYTSKKVAKGEREEKGVYKMCVYHKSERVHIHITRNFKLFFFFFCSKKNKSETTKKNKTTVTKKKKKREIGRSTLKRAGPRVSWHLRPAGAGDDDFVVTMMKKGTGDHDPPRAPSNGVCEWRKLLDEKKKGWGASSLSRALDKKDIKKQKKRTKREQSEKLIRKERERRSK